MGTSTRQRSAAQIEPVAAPAPERRPRGAQDRRGNAAIAERLGSRLDTLLHEKVGPELAALVREHLSEEELLGYVQPGIDALIERAREGAAGGDHGLTDAQVASALADLDTQLTDAASALLARLQLDERLAVLVQEQPELALAAALAGVVVWALSNPDLPAISHGRDLGGGHAVEGSVDLGRLHDLTVDHLEAQWSWQSDTTAASLRAFGGARDGGWGGEGALSHTLEGGAELGASGRYFHGRDGQEATAGLSFDGARTDATLDGRWRRGEDGDAWGLGALLTHDGERTDTRLDAGVSEGPDGRAWNLGGSVAHEGVHTNTRVEGQVAQDAQGVRTGHLAGSVVRDREGWRQHANGRVGLDGAWEAEAGVRRSHGDRVWSLTGDASQDTEGARLGTLRGSWADTHDGFTSEASGRVATDGSWDVAGGLTGTDAAQPWSLTGTAGRSATDTEADWELTGRYGRALDADGRTTLAGTQQLGRDRALTRLDLEHAWDGGAASAWVERSRSATGTVDALGGRFESTVGGANAYGQGWLRSDRTWEASAGVRLGDQEDPHHWFAEGYTGRDSLGEADHGVRAGLRWTF